MDQIKFYIASRHRDKALELRDLLLDAGFQVTSRWLNDEKFGVGPYSYKERRISAIEDEEDVRAADALVLIADPKGELCHGGKHTETGMAIILDYPIYVIGRRENVFHWHPSVQLFLDNNSLISFLTEK